MKILYVTTVSTTMGFFRDHFKMLINEGYTIELACNCDKPVPQFCIDMGLKVHDIKFSRSPFSKSNIVAYKQLKRLLLNEKYDIVHTHTPNASACARLASRKLRKSIGLKVIYTAHGFHFYKGAPLKNWIFFYPIEKICSRWTDVLITINQEDFERAKKKMRAKKIVYVPGVGIDFEEMTNVVVDKVEKRKEIDVPNNAKLLISVGELNDNKNHETVIRAINGLDLYYIIAGTGDKRDYLQNLIDEQGMTDRIKLLGFRSDVKELYAISDAFIFPSFREGLSVSVMEAMASGLPCVVSNIRGNKDLVDVGGGFLFDPACVDDCKKSIETLFNVEKTTLGKYNQEKIEKFELSLVLEQMKEIYQSIEK